MKNFRAWHNIKSEVDIREKVPFFHEREVWWCYLGLNVGYEQDGKGTHFSRPILIIRKFNHRTFVAIPLSTKIKDNKYFFKINMKNGQVRSVILSQIKLLDAKRLQEKIEILDRNQFIEIKKAVTNII